MPRLRLAMTGGKGVHTDGLICTGSCEKAEIEIAAPAARNDRWERGLTLAG